MVLTESKFEHFVSKTKYYYTVAPGNECNESNYPLYVSSVLVLARMSFRNHILLNKNGDTTLDSVFRILNV